MNTIELSLLLDNLLVAAPVMSLGTAAMLVMLIGAFWPKANRALTPWISVIFIAVTAYITVWAYGFQPEPIGMQVFDGFTLVFDLIILGATAAAILVAMPYINREGMARGEYYSLMMFSASGAMLMAGADNLIMLFLGIEMLSIPLYVLAGFARAETDSEEAAMKYFLLGAFSSAFLVFGTGLVYATLGTTSIPAILDGLAYMEPGSDALLIVGFAMLVVALAFKVGLVPFHMWVPDVYQGAPTSVTAFMAVVAKCAGYSAFVRVAALGMENEIATWDKTLWVLCAATMIWGNLLAIAQQNVKRLLAYSSIAHAGYLLMGVVSGSVYGFSAMLYYMAAYSAMILGAFSVIILLSGKGDAYENINDYRGAARKSPILGVMMAVFMFSMAGMPPFAGFFGKLYLFLAAIEQGYVGLTVIAVLTSVIAVYYYLRLTVVMWMEEPRPEEDTAKDAEPPGITKWILGGLTAVVVALGILSSPVIRWTDTAAVAAIRTAEESTLAATHIRQDNEPGDRLDLGILNLPEGREDGLDNAGD